MAGRILESMTEFPLSRPLLILLLTIYCLSIFLHIEEISWWMLLCFAFISVWRVNILRERWQQPRLLMKVLLTLLSVLLVFLEYQQLFSIEPMLALLLFSLSLKIMEIRYRRDYILILFLACFVVASSFLFKQSILHSLLALCVFFLIIVALLQVHSGHQQESIHWRRAFSIVAKMLLQSTVLMLVLMLVIPRVNPLWSVPLRSSTGITGISDSMSPGDFDQLIRSNELAFRVSYLDDAMINPISISQLYWRGLVLDDFDGRRWTRFQSVSSVINRLENPVRSKKTFNNRENNKIARYEVLLEPTGQHWLFGLSPFFVDKINLPLVYSSADEAFAKEKIDQRIKYQLTSYLTNGLAGHQMHITSAEYHRLTTLPDNINPLTRQQASQWYAQSTSLQNYIEIVLDFYRKNFRYTLSPPKLGEHSVDEFLFQSQQGFCEHYASSFVVLMRSVGIPARVVVGYQGGKWNQDENFLSVYQRDAHAWAEVWFAGQGWVRVDPTAAVSVTRIEQGLEAALPENEREQLQHYGNSYLWLTNVYDQWQVLNYRWQRWVLNYDANQQKSLLQNFLGNITPLKLALLLLIPMFLVALSFSVAFFFNHFKPLSREQKIIRRLQKKLQNHGVLFEAGETLNHYCLRAAHILPDHKRSLIEIQQLLESVFYNPESHKEKSYQLERLIRSL